MTTTQRITVRCPKCDTIFDIKKLVTSGHTGQDTDFRPHFLGEDPLNYFVHICPKCKFPALDDELIFARSTVSAFEMKLPVEKKLEMLAERQLLEGEIYKASKTYHRIVWVYRALGSKTEKPATIKAIKSYLKALKERKVPDEDKATVIYVVGELYRRIGEEEKAIEFFKRVKKYALPGQERIKELAKQQALSPKDTL